MIFSYDFDPVRLTCGLPSTATTMPATGFVGPFAKAGDATTAARSVGSANPHALLIAHLPYSARSNRTPNDGLACTCLRMYGTRALDLPFSTSVAFIGSCETNR